MADIGARPAAAIGGLTTLFVASADWALLNLDALATLTVLGARLAPELPGIPVDAFQKAVFIVSVILFVVTLTRLIRRTFGE